ncbi:aminomethyl-transferring glycine dehydrogenase subunit GcvPA [candidate division KSB1 bacterium]|nr:MAG: aminomethyl-transferring glycine dehydrogenase subunit GcvPA [candidate division KSB1 bacterium]
MPFIPTTEENRRQMLKTIGVTDFDQLLQSIPEQIRFKDDYNLPDPLSEYEVTKLLKSIAEKNKHTSNSVCFLGGGAYDHFIPAAVVHIVSRPEFYTAYTPYQAEVSQGTLQAIYEYQSMICDLTGMDVANASMYDGASALAESALLSSNHKRRQEILISKSVHPYHRQVVKTYCHRSGIVLKEIDIKNGVTDLEKLEQSITDNCAGVLVQHPNFFGSLEPVDEISEIVHKEGAIFTVSVDPISLGVLAPPSEYGADIVTGEAQVLGNALGFGGPYVGIFAATKELIRKIPGRIAGITQDSQGRRGFVLTLQTREQHIRREKATSNICSNEQLCALAATVYMALMGKKGIPAVANLCVQKSHYLAEKLTGISGVEPLFEAPFFKEFAVKLPVPAKEIIDKMKEKDIFAGIDLSRFDYNVDNALLIAVTEKRTKEEMDQFAEILSEIV